MERKYKCSFCEKFVEEDNFKNHAEQHFLSLQNSGKDIENISIDYLPITID